ncbi:MAG: L,D-transpeptidase [Microbacterium sp.]|uniref:L,D-transpeptidase family protein n=1 Tax=Microbacterium sp. TaxID=51671 RepID=UPI0039E36A61
MPLSRRGTVALAVAAGVAVAAAVVVTIGVGLGAPQTATSTETAAVTPTPTPTPTPTATGPAADTAVYDLSGLPTADVFAVNPALPVDDDPAGGSTGYVATPASDAIPVFAAPGTAPVAALPSALTYGGTTLPVIEKDDNWVRVLISGRQATPSEGDPAQLTAWLRAADVTLSQDDTRVEVSLSARTITIVSPTGSELVTSDFGWGAAATPTPVGRTFIMYNAVTSFSYTRGHPIVYLGIQSPVLDGFDGQSVAVTAFHYYDDHDGPISNGCIRLGADAIDRLAQLPLGTLVTITA